MREVKETHLQYAGKFWLRWICFFVGHKIKTIDLSESMWRDKERHICKRCARNWIEIGFLQQD